MDAAQARRRAVVRLGVLAAALLLAGLLPWVTMGPLPARLLALPLLLTGVLVAIVAVRVRVGAAAAAPVRPTGRAPLRRMRLWHRRRVRGAVPALPRRRLRPAQPGSGAADSRP